MHRITRSRTLAALAAATTAATFPRRTRAATALSVGQIGNSIAFFPIFVARSEGYFRDAGLDVNVTVLQSGALVGTAVTSGSVDVGCGVITDVFQLLHANRACKVIGSLVDGYYIDIVASTQMLADAKVSRASKLAVRIDALRGKKIGITGPGSGTEALVYYLARMRHIDPMRDLELVNMGTDQAAIIAAMKTGRIDGVSFAWPLTMIAEAQHVGKGLIMPALGDVPDMKGQVQGTIYARPDVINGRPNDLAAFVHAVGRAEQTIKSDPDRSRGLLKQYNANLGDDSMNALFSAYVPTIPNQCRVGVASYERALAFHRILGFVGPNGNTYGDVVASSIIDKALRSA